MPRTSWLSSTQSLTIAFIPLLLRVESFSSFLPRSPRCKHTPIPVLPFGRPSAQGCNDANVWSINRLQQCWAIPATQQDEPLEIHVINGGIGTFTKDLPPYRLPSNLTDDEIRSLKPDERYRYRIRQLLEYKADHGHLNVKRSENIGLCNWIVTQRCEYRMYSRKETRKDSFLTKERIEQLTKIGFDWRTEEKGLTPSWLKWYEKLERYEAKHGHVCASKEDDPALHKWVCNQRHLYSRWKRGAGPSAGMNQVRCDKLEALGMVWSMRKSGLTRYDQQWKLRLQELIEFKKKHGHLLVPRQDPLGEWMAHQRKEYKDKIKYNVSALTEEREMQLREIGFDFDGKRSFMNGKWQQRFKELKAFYKKHNHTNVPTSKKTLKNWVSTQRAEYRRLKAGEPTSMTQEHVDALLELGFHWDLRFSKWMEQYQKLRKYHEQNNDTLVPADYPEDPSFGKWVAMQRSYYRKAKRGQEPIRLSEKQIKMLEEIEFLEDAPKMRHDSKHALAWNKMAKELKQFKEKHGHCRVRQTANKTTTRLGMWVRNQRRQYRLLQENSRTSSLTPERIKVLDEMGFEWPMNTLQKQNETWNARLQELKEFKEEHGSFAVPRRYAKNPKLPTWYHNTKQQYRLFKQNKPSKLNPERIEALEAIGFVGGLGRDATWNSLLEDLKEFHAAHGHCRVPFSESPKLYRWVHRQRQLYRRLKQGKPSTLTPERIRLLEELDFEWVVSRRE